jgi:hypothetical protein
MDTLLDLDAPDVHDSPSRLRPVAWPVGVLGVLICANATCTTGRSSNWWRWR